MCACHWGGQSVPAAGEDRACLLPGRTERLPCFLPPGRTCVTCQRVSDADGAIWSSVKMRRTERVETRVGSEGV